MPEIEGTGRGMKFFHTSPGVTAFETADLPSERMRFLYDLWKRKRGRRRLPDRSDFTLRELKPVLGYLSITEKIVEKGGRTVFRLRLYGTRLAEMTGNDPTGLIIDDVEGAEGIVTRFRWIVETCRPLFRRGVPVPWATHDFRHYDVLALPLGRGRDVRQILCLLEFA